MLIGLLLVTLTSCALTQRGASANSGGTYYVATDGSDSNPGTEKEPWRTVRKAADTLAAGDTVFIKEGTYGERVVPGNSGSVGEYITYRAFPGHTATIDGAGIVLPTGWGGLFDITGRSYIKVTGLEIVNAGPGDEHTGILVDGSSYVTLEGNYTRNTTSSGIGVWDSNNVVIDGNEVELACNDGGEECITVAGTDDFIVKNNSVHHSGPGTNGGEGIDVKDGSFNGEVYRNHVHHINRLGIYVDAWDKHTHDIDVFGNEVHDCTAEGFTLASEQGGLLENVNVYNNIAYHNQGSGITFSDEGTNRPLKNIEVINNTLYGNGSSTWGGGISVENPDIDGLTIRNNACSRNVNFQMQAEVSVANLVVDHNLVNGYGGYAHEIRGADYVEADPLFVNPAVGDFHLQQGSPAIDAGSSAGAPETDFEGTSRPQGNGYDIGAFEERASFPRPTSHRECAHGSIGVTHPGTTWYLPEGATAGGFETWVLIMNPGSSTADVGLEYQTESGSVAGPRLNIRPGTRQTVCVSDTVQTYDVSTMVTSDEPVVAERAVYYKGRTCAHDSIGVALPANNWYLAEGATAGGFETWVLVMNPGEDDANVQLGYQTEAGEVPGPSLVLKPGTRQTVNVSDTVWTHEVSTRVTSDAPVVAERAMYFGGRTCAHDSIGTTGPTDRWYLAEGATDGGFETWVLVQNPQELTAHVMLTYMTGEGEVAGPVLELAPRSRETVNVADTVQTYNVSTVVTSDVPVVAERAMYFGGRTCAHDSIGATGPADRWYLAEGATDGGFDTWVLVMNPGSQAARVAITYMTGDGERAGPVLDLPPRSRETVNVADTVRKYDVSTVVTSDEPVVVERAMYYENR